MASQAVKWVLYILFIPVLLFKDALRYLGFNTEDTEYVMGTDSSLECWERLHETIEAKGRGLEREQSWWMERRQKVSISVPLNGKGP